MKAGPVAPPGRLRIYCRGRRTFAHFERRLGYWWCLSCGERLRVVEP